MGMAASQARFLGITARKTNTEYEGQQVNQQRTALANQSANLFNQLLGLDLPVPPNKNDSQYTKTVYSFIDDNAEKATIESIINNPDPATNAQWPKIIKYTTQENDSLSYRNNLLTTGSIASQRLENGELYHQITIGTTPTELFRLQVSSDKTYKKDQEAKLNIYNSIKATDGEEKAIEETEQLFKYEVSEGVYRFVNLKNATFNPSGVSNPLTVYEGTGEKSTVNPTIKLNKTIDADGNPVYTIKEGGGTDNNGKTLVPIDNFDNGSTISGGTVTDLAMIKDIQDSYKETAADEVFYKYVIGTQAYYVPESQTIGDWNIADTERDATHTPLTLKTNVPTEPPYGYFVQDAEVVSTKEYKAKVTYDSSGRLQSILLDNGTNAPYSISVNSITDEAKYEDAMNQYKYDLAKYDKTVEDINAQTEIIQVQDRTLELRLKQLDTEQEALTQEMDAIKKVIDKNVETTFKTFA